MNIYKYMYWGLFRELPQKDDGDRATGEAMLLSLGTTFYLLIAVQVLDDLCGCAAALTGKASWVSGAVVLYLAHGWFLIRTTPHKAIVDYFDSSPANSFIASLLA
jgi:hypothetical protein